MTAQFVTIIVPIYNAEHTLNHCLSSILAQTYKHIELILVNDGSSDRSLHICNEFAEQDSRIKVIDQDNKGPSHARNRGIDIAQGTYIQFVDADDVLKKTMTETLVQMANKKCDLVLCGYEVNRNNHYEIIKPNIEGIFTWGQFINHVGKLYEYNLLQSPCNKLYKNDIIKNNAILFPLNIDLGEDLLFNLDYLQACHSFGITQHELYIYYDHEHSLSKQVHANYLTHQFMLINKVKQLLNEHDAYSNENKKALDSVISQVIINTFSQLFVQYHSEKKHINCAINKLFENKIIQENYNKLNNHLQAKLLKFLIHFNLRQATYLFLKFKYSLDQQSKQLYFFFKAINNFSKK